MIGRAPGQTTGQLRASARRAVLAADPAAADRHREKAEKEARVEVWSEPAGTAALVGRDLRSADVIAADKRIDGLARQLKAAGIEGSLSQLRARAYLALLLGQPMPGLLPPGAGPYGARTAAEGAITDPVAGAVNLTMPLSSFLGASGQPGEVAGFGPVTAADGRALVDRLAGERGSRWCLTLTGQDGRAVAHGCARARGPLAVARQRAAGGNSPSRLDDMHRAGLRSLAGCWGPPQLRRGSGLTA